MRLSHTAFALVLALISAGFVLAGHFWMIDRAGSPVPIHDQWQAEAEMTYLPAMAGDLSVSDLFRYHGEHRIAPTRAMALALFELSGWRWDVRLQMTVNSFLCAAFAIVLVRVASRVLAGGALVAFAGIAGAILASPLFYGNTLWGFQSQFYFLLLFSCLHFLLVLSRPMLSRGWWGGIACSVAACVSMGSGWFSAAVIAGLYTPNLFIATNSSSRSTLRISWGIHVALVLVGIVSAPAIPSTAIHVSDFVHTFIHCLGWPQPNFHLLGPWIWLPFAIFVVAIPIQKSIGNLLIAALGFWVILQITAISWARSTPAIVITPRYYEIFAVGVAANALATCQLVRHGLSSGLQRWRRLAVVGGLSVWGALALSAGFRCEESQRRQDLDTCRNYARSQVSYVRQFLNTGDIAILKSVAYPNVPHPDPEYLASLLKNPAVREILPSELNDRPVPWTVHVAAGLRRAWIFFGVVGLVSLVAAFMSRRTAVIRNQCGVLDLKSAPSETPSIPQSALAGRRGSEPESSDSIRAGDAESSAGFAVSSSRGFFVLLCLAVCTFVVASRWMLIERTGNPVPYHDQWFAEPPSFFLSTWTEKISWFLSPHVEHRIVPTRVLSYLLLQANGFWDVRLQMLVNAVLAAIVFIPLLVLTNKFLARPYLVMAAIGASWLAASSVLYENALWGFQSQFYFLVLFSLLHLLLMLERPAFSAGWWMGWVLGCAACVSMGSGVLAPTAVLLTIALRCCRTWRIKREDTINVSALAVLLIAGVWFMPPALSSDASFHLSAFWRTFWHSLAFPAREYSALGLLLWLPFVFAATAIVRRRTVRSDDLVLLGVGLWVLLQATGIAYRRPIAGPVLPNRYYDILLVGLFVNLSACGWIWRHGPRRHPAAGAKIFFRFGVAAWITCVAWNAVATHRVNHGNLEPVFRLWRDEQIRRLNLYVRTHDESVLRTAKPGELPLPDPAMLINLLSRPDFQNQLPLEIHLPVVLGFSAPNAASLNNALPDSVPNEPGLLHRGTYISGSGAGAVIQTESNPAAKQPDSRLMFKVAGDLKAGETELRIRDDQHRVAATITNLQASQLTPVIVEVPGKLFTVEVFDVSHSRWLAFLEPTEVGRLSQWCLRILPFGRPTQVVAGWGLGLLLAWSLALPLGRGIRRAISR